jgi:hypothetical protein
MKALKLKGHTPGETTNLQLIKLARENDVRVDAIVFKDDLKKLITSPNITQIIINMANSTDLRGTHWVCISIDSNQIAYYFDSFGEVPLLEVIEFCKDRKIANLYYNRIQEQSEHNAGCGEFCIWFLKASQSRSV